MTNKLPIQKIIIITILIGALAGTAEARRRGGGGGGGDHMSKGIELAQQKQYDAAIVEFTKAIEASPKDVRNYTNRAFSYRDR